MNTHTLTETQSAQNRKTVKSH